MQIPVKSNELGKSRNTLGRNFNRRLGGGWSQQSTKSVGKYVTNSNQWRPSTIQNNEYHLHSSSIDIYSDSLENENSQLTWPRKVLTANDKYLFDIPESLFPTFRQPTTTTSIVLIVVSALLSLATTIPLRTLLTPDFWNRIFLDSISFLKNQKHVQGFLWSMMWKNVLKFTIKTLAFTEVLKALWQEKFFPPSRVSTTDLATNYYLPTTLSKYQLVELNDNTNSLDKAINVHWIEYENKKRTKKSTSAVDTIRKTDLVYFNHGFGASSLSWLPSIQKLTDLFGAQFGLGHDAVGFGFTDRPQKIDDQEEERNSFLHYYTANYSAKIAVSLIMSRLEKIIEASLHDNETNDNQQDPTIPAYSVVLFGHSMGSITTLRTALKLQKVFNEKYKKSKSLKIQLFLVAPAFGFTNIHEKVKHASSVLEPVIGMVYKRVLGPIVSPLIRYVLRRAVGTPNFWKRGLCLAWGDKSRLSDTDVLRYQWPAIVEGWEQGMINFATAQATRHSNDKIQKNQDEIQCDEDLLHSVLAMPEVVKTCVILGGRDKVIRPSLVRKFLTNFPTVTIRQLDNSGHDPFEEEVDLFVDTINQLK